jgi:hypothetical protein
VRDRRPADARRPLDVLLRPDEVDGDRVGLGRHRQRRRLVGGRDERLEVGARHRADVEPGEHGVRELDEPDAEAIAAADVLDQLSLDERAELARHGARVRADASRDLVRAERAAVREDVEDRKRPAGRGDALSGWLTGPRHRDSIPLYRMQLRDTQ